MKDRFGNERCDGYRIDDFRLCRSCFPNANIAKQPNINCNICGGYGEVPVMKNQEINNEYGVGLNDSHVPFV